MIFAKTNENTELRGKDEIIAKQELIKFAKQETKNLNMSHDLLDEGNKLLTELYMRGYSQEYIASKVKEQGDFIEKKNIISGFVFIIYNYFIWVYMQ